VPERTDHQLCMPELMAAKLAATAPNGGSVRVPLTSAVTQRDVICRRSLLPHVQLMTSLRPYMGPTKFVTWSITAADGRPSLAGALERLASG